MSSLNHVLRLISIGIFIILLSACFQSTNPADSGFTDSILTELREMKGEYLWNDELKRHIYSEKSFIEKIPPLSVVAVRGILHRGHTMG